MIRSENSSEDLKGIKSTHLYAIEGAVVEHVEGEEEGQQRDGEQRRGELGPRHAHHQHAVRQLTLGRPERRPRQPSAQVDKLDGAVRCSLALHFFLVHTWPWGDTIGRAVLRCRCSSLSSANLLSPNGNIVFLFK